MPGPTIAYAEVKVDLDGKRIPAEARRVGEESGAAMGEAHDKEFSKRVDQSYGDFRDRVKKEMRDSGKLSGESFTEAFQDRIKAKRGQMVGQLADIFAEPAGLDKFRASMGELGEGIGGVDIATGSLNDKLNEMHREGLLLTSEYDDLQDVISKWGDEARTAAIKADELEVAQRKLNDSLNRLQADESASQIRELRLEEERVQAASKELGESLRADLINRLHAVGEEMNSVHGEALKLNEAFDRRKLDEYVAGFGTGAEGAAAMRSEFLKLYQVQRDAHEAFRGGTLDIDGLGAALERNSDKVRILGANLGASEGTIRRASNGFRLGAREIDNLGSKAEKSITKFTGFGKAVEGLGGRFKASFSALSNFDPFDNVGQAILLIIGLLGPLANLAGAAAGGLLILGSAAGAGAVGVGLMALAFTGLFSKTAKVPAELQPVVSAMKGLKDDFLALRTELQIHVFAGLEGDINRLASTVLPKLKGGFSIVGDSLNGLLKQFATGIQTPEGLARIEETFKNISSIMTPLGGAALTLGKILVQVFNLAAPFAKDFAEDLQLNLDNFSKFLDSPKGKTEVTDFLQKAQVMLGKVGDVIAIAVDGIGDLMTPENFQATLDILQSIGDAVPGIVNFANAMTPLVAAFFSLLPVIGDVAGGIGDFANSLIDAYNGGILGIIDGINLVMGAFGDLATIASSVGDGIQKIFRGDFEGAFASFNKAIETATTKTGGLKDAMTVMGGGAGAAAAALRIAGDDGRASLDKLSSGFHLTGDGAAKFQGIVAEMVHGNKNSLAALKDDKSLDSMIATLGLSGRAADKFRNDVGKALAQTGQSYSVLDQSSKTSLSNTARQLGITGSAAKPFQRALSDAADGSRSKIKGLASATDLESLERKLGATGAASKTQFANRIISAMNESGVSIDKLPPKIQALVAKYGTIPKLKVTDIKAEDHASGTISAIQSKINGIYGKSVTVTVNYATGKGKNVFTGTGGLANGGIFDATGILRGGPERLANGGILRNPTRLAGGRVLAGEAGPEAVVPLTGALSKIDPSVRGLAAAARGLAEATPKARNYFAEGAIQVVTPARDPETVAEQVMDRLIPVGV